MTPRPGTALRLVCDDAPDANPDSLSGLDPHQVAAQELLRPAGPRDAGRELAPFSRAWFEELELKRYSPHGAWLRRALEFTRHANDRVVLLGPGAGTDAVQYHRHGATVTACARTRASAALVRRNFESRGLPVTAVVASGAWVLPFEDGHFDLACLNLLDFAPPDPAAPPLAPADLAPELYRILKPGGKLFVLAPARYDARFWSRVAFPLRHLVRPIAPLSTLPGTTGRALKQALPKFTEARCLKRHVRRSELPYMLRTLPVWLTERLIGRMLVFRAFKPVSAALEGFRAHAA